MGRIVSLQGQVELEVPATSERRPAALEMPLCVGDTIHVGPLSRAAVQLLASETVLRLDQNTSSRFTEPATAERSFLDLLRGVVHFLSRVPRALEVHTPYLTAGIEGTEFLVAVDVERQETRIVVYEGVVAAENAHGKLSLKPFQAAVAGAERAPRLETVVRSRDAVNWTLYYQPVLAALTAPGAARPGVPVSLQELQAALATGGVSAALARLDALPAARRSEATETWRAALLMRVGRWQEARQALEGLLRSATVSGEAHALLSVIYVTQNERARAMTEAQKAVGLSPQSAAAYLALSYAQQAGFDLEAARQSVEKAVEVAPEDALAWARLSELWLSFGYRGRALQAAERAVALAPGVARAHAVLGFAALTRIDLETAAAAFEKAIALASDDPLPRLGLGLAKIRDGALAEGRREIEVAVALASNSALLRSYLGKAYFEEKRGPLDAEQFEIAKELDPNDPTAFFYDAIRLQTENRPVEALRQIERAIALNDNRAVYRSRILLDQDLAARGSRLGSIYRDLGFEQLALEEGWRSVNIDPQNHAAHRLLADTYSVLPRHEIARDSELLQSQLLQPINVDPVQPRLFGNGLTFLDDIGLSGVGFNEFSQLYAGDQIRFDGDGIIGSDQTRGSNAIVSGIYDKASFSAGHFHFDTDGVRQNNEINQNIYNAFGQYSFTDRTAAQVELRAIDSEFGDRALRFDPANYFTDSHQDLESSSVRVGFRHAFAPHATLIGSYVHRELDDDLNTGAGFSVNVRDKADFFEARQLYQGRWFHVTAGAGYLHSNVEADTSVTIFPFLPPIVARIEETITHANAYIYGTANYFDDIALTLGASYDSFDSDNLDRHQLNPKIGAIWTPFTGTTLRVAAFKSLKRTLTSSQTIEPTQVAGFNQFFDDFNGTEAWRYGAAIEQKFDISNVTMGPDLYVGLEVSQRDLEVPTTFLTPVPTTVDVGWKERFGRAYLYWTPLNRVAVALEYQYEHFDRDAFAMNDFSLAEVTTHRVPLEVRYFDPSGIFALARATYVDQDGRFEAASGGVVSGDDRFWVMDASFGYRFPNRLGFASLDIRNVFDETFNFQDSDPTSPRITSGRTIFARLTLHF